MPRTLFVVDDSATMRKVFELTFAGEDINVVTHEGSDGAAQRAKEARPSVAIVDVGLGDGASGYDVVRAIRAEAGLGPIPIYLLYSEHSPLDDASARGCGASGALAKPFDSQAIIDRVRTAMTPTASSPQPTAPTPPTPAAAPVALPRPMAPPLPRSAVTPPVAPRPAPAPAPPLAARPAPAFGGARGHAARDPGPVAAHGDRVARRGARHRDRGRPAARGSSRPRPSPPPRPRSARSRRAWGSLPRRSTRSPPSPARWSSAWCGRWFRPSPRR
ncbi:MAG: response regulator [Polyangiales bacterium]